MSLDSSHLNLRISDTPTGVARQAADWIVQQANTAIDERGLFRIALAGGSTPRVTYGLLVEADTDWSKWHIYYGDERCLPPQDPERNSHMAQSNWLEKIPLPEANHHPIPAEAGAIEAAAQYHQVLPKKLDLVLLGMGQDGHTASLFPGQEASWQGAAGERAIAVFNAPKPPPERVSLSLDYILAAEQRAVLVTGADKQAPCQQWFEGHPLPIQQATASAAVVFADRAAMNDQ